MFKNLIRLMRPKHYIKNSLIFMPLIFSGELFKDHHIVKVIVGAIIFSLVASVVYIFNDIRDVDKDRNHPKKKFRPIASNAVSVNQATFFAIILAVISLIACLAIKIPIEALLLLLAYVVMNIAYSLGLKDIAIVDVAILAAGFVLRVLYGGVIVNISVSRWLYLTILAGAFYMALGKRRGELISNGSKSRKVNLYYTRDFLDKNMLVCAALTLVFYSLWATAPSKHIYSMSITIPVVIIMFLAYSLEIERGSSFGDPVDVLTENKSLAFFALAYVIITTYILYA